MNNNKINKSSSIMDDIILNNLRAYSKRHDGVNAIPVMLPPCEVSVWLHSDNPDFEAFVIKGIGRMLQGAMLHDWEESLAKACRDYCHICMVDPMLVEAYLQMRFEEFCASVYDDLEKLLARRVSTANGKPFKSKAFV